MENIGEIKELCSKMLVNWFLIEKKNSDMKYTSDVKDCLEEIDDFEPVY